MKQFFLTIAGVFAGLMLFFVVLPMLFIFAAAGAAQPTLPARSVLEIDLRRGSATRPRPIRSPPWADRACR